MQRNSCPDLKALMYIRPNIKRRLHDCEQVRTVSAGGAKPSIREPGEGGGFLGGSNSKESSCNAGDLGLIPGWGRSPGEGQSSPLQCPCLESPRGRGAWRAAVHGSQRIGQDRISTEYFERRENDHEIYKVSHHTSMLSQTSEKEKYREESY